MKHLLLLALLGAVTGAPQNWPYRDSLMPYRYGYPSQSQYKYLPQVEDDEDVGPYPAGLARQDFVVGSDGDRVRPTTESVVAAVVETGSVAPVVDPSKEPPRSTVAPSPPPPRPVGPEQNVGKPVQPPPFPPARPPPTPPPKDEEEEEDEDEDDDESEEADDEEAEDRDNNEEPPQTDDEEEEEEEERRRQEPLSEEKEEPVANADVASSPTVVESTVPLVNKSIVAEPASVEEVNVPPAVESNEIPTKPAEVEDESEEEQGLDDEVEALVPGYVTDQGEVLVPVDTVTGDQPISIVPDPYTPPRHGVPINGASNYRFNSYNNPYYYSDVYEDVLGRRESEESGEEGAESKNQGDDEDSDNPNSNESVPEARNEYLTSFPPSRTPALYAVINSRFPVDSQEESFEGQSGSQQNQFGPVIAYRIKQTQQRPSVSVAVALSGGSQNTQSHSSQQQQFIRNPFFPLYSQQVRNNPFSGQYVRNPFVNQQVRRNPYVGYFAQNPYAMFQQFQQKRYPSPYGQQVQQLRNPYGSPYNQYRPNPYINRFVNRPVFNPYDYEGPYSPQEMRRPFYGAGPIGRPFYPGPSPFGGYGPRPVFGPQGFGQAKPVYLNRRPGVKPKPVGHNKVVIVSPKKPNGGKVQNKRPTPVVHQDEGPYTYEDPQAYNIESNESNQEDYVQNLHHGASVVHKSRRAAKMKKVTKKDKASDKSKKAADADPLQILKKVHSKKA